MHLFFQKAHIVIHTKHYICMFSISSRNKLTRYSGRAKSESLERNIIKVEDTRYSVKIYLSSTIWAVFTIMGYKLEVLRPNGSSLYGCLGLLYNANPPAIGQSKRHRSPACVSEEGRQALVYSTEMDSFLFPRRHCLSLKLRCVSSR